MLNKTAYRLSIDANKDIPVIVKVDFRDPTGKSWREAKKDLRQWYMNEIALLRQVTEKEYMNASESIPF